MRELMIVGAGSFVGGVGRYYLGGYISHVLVLGHFPLSTLLVNFIGCLVIGIVGGLAEYHHMFSYSTRLFIITGMLGGFTTFSAFGYETVFLMRTYGIELALVNVILSVALSLAAVWLGLKMTMIL